MFRAQKCQGEHGLIYIFLILFSQYNKLQPTHPGAMTQLGLNLGPRHARVLGWAKSFTKKLDSSDMALHDLDCIGAVSITWSILQAVMPQEIIIHVNSCLAGYGLPRIATRNVAGGE